VSDDAPKTGKKIHRDEVARRMAFVESALATLMPLRELYPAFHAEFGVSRRCAEKYVRRVHERWKLEGEADRETKRVEIERAADLAFRLAAAAKNPDAKAMIAALTLKAKLYGLVSERHEHSGPNGGPIPHTIDVGALHRRLRERLARRAGEPDAGGTGGTTAG
jgi:hypothetical protein